MLFFLQKNKHTYPLSSNTSAPSDSDISSSYQDEHIINNFFLQIKAELMFFGAPIKDVRLMRKSSGEIYK